MFRLSSFRTSCVTTIRCSCLLILVCPLGYDDRLDPPHRLEFTVRGIKTIVTTQWADLGEFRCIAGALIQENLVIMQASSQLAVTRITEIERAVLA